MSFGLNLLKSKIDKIKDTVVNAAVTADPKAAIAAEIKTRSEELDEISLHIAKTRSSISSLKSRADDLQKNIDTRLLVANKLNERLNEATDDTKKKDIEHSLTTLLDDIDGSKSQLEGINTDISTNTGFLADLQKALDEKSEQLRGARSALERAEKDLEIATYREQQAKEMAEHVKDVQNLTTTTSGIDTALQALKKKTAEKNEHIDALNTVTSALNHPADDLIKEVTAEVSTPKPSVSDRLKALNTK